MSIKIVSIDVDGTLHNSKNSISPKTVETVKKAVKQGVQIVITTGRPFPGVVPILDELEITGDDHYVITFNGGTVQTASGKIISQTEMNREDFDELFEFSKTQTGSHFQLETNQFAETINHQINPFAQKENYLVNLPLRVHDADKLPNDLPLIKAMFNGESKQLDKIQANFPTKLQERINMLRGASYNLEFVSLETSKGNGLTMLAEKLGVDMQDTMAIGDQGNDLSMLQVAGIAVAMGNGIDQLKEIADFITEDNDNDGVAVALEKFVLNL